MAVLTIEDDSLLSITAVMKLVVKILPTIETQTPLMPITLRMCHVLAPANKFSSAADLVDINKPIHNGVAFLGSVCLPDSDERVLTLCGMDAALCALAKRIAGDVQTEPVRRFQITQQDWAPDQQYFHQHIQPLLAS
jgi:hypothetical protein